MSARGRSSIRRAPRWHRGGSGSVARRLHQFVGIRNHCVTTGGSPKAAEGAGCAAALRAPGSRVTAPWPELPHDLLPGRSLLVTIHRWIGFDSQAGRKARWCIGSTAVRRKAFPTASLTWQLFDDRHSLEQQAETSNRAELLNLWHGVSRRRYPGRTLTHDQGVGANTTRGTAAVATAARNRPGSLRSVKKTWAR